MLTEQNEQKLKKSKKRKRKTCKKQFFKFREGKKEGAGGGGGGGVHTHVFRARFSCTARQHARLPPKELVFCGMLERHAAVAAREVGDGVQVLPVLPPEQHP